MLLKWGDKLYQVASCKHDVACFWTVTLTNGIVIWRVRSDMLWRLNNWNINDDSA